MQEENNEKQNKNSEIREPINCIDFSKIQNGQSIFNGMLFDKNNKCLGPLPKKEYSSYTEYKEEIMELLKKEIIDIVKEEKNGAVTGWPEKTFNEPNIDEEDNKSEEIPNPKPILWTEFDKVVFPEQKWWIEGIIPFEGIVILASPSGEKKTWIAMDIARSIVSGGLFLGKFRTIVGNVLYIDQEMPKQEAQRRGRQIGLNNTEKDVWFLSQNELNLSDKEKTDWLFEFIKENKIAVVIIDTFRAVAGGLHEEKAEEVREFFNRFKPLKDMGVCIIFLDHCRKPRAFEGKIPKKDQLFASQDKVASVEILLMLKSEVRSDDIFVYMEKNRLSKELNPFKIIMRDELNSYGSPVKTKLEYAGELEERETKKEEAKAIIVNILEKSDGYERPELLKVLYSEAKIAEKNASDALRELEANEEIMMEKHGRKNFYYIPTKKELNLLEQDNLINP